MSFRLETYEHEKSYLAQSASFAKCGSSAHTPNKLLSLSFFSFCSAVGVSYVQLIQSLHFVVFLFLLVLAADPDAAPPLGDDPAADDVTLVDFFFFATRPGEAP